MSVVLFKVIDEERKSVLARGKYKLHYPIGEIVEAVTGSLGLFCFTNEDTAELFAISNGCYVIEVSPVDCEVTTTLVIADCRFEVSLDAFYGSSKLCGAVCPLDYSVLARKVKVLT